MAPKIPANLSVSISISRPLLGHSYHKIARLSWSPTRACLNTLDWLFRRGFVLDEGGHDILLRRRDGAVGSRHMRACIRIRKLQRQEIHQRHPKILPLG